jgi:hypothetical protein
MAILTTAATNGHQAPLKRQHASHASTGSVAGVFTSEYDIAKAAAAQLNPYYEVTERPLGDRRHLRIACLGAGYSGLMMGIVFSERLQGKNADFVIYERNEDLGGTWLENRFVHCADTSPLHDGDSRLLPSC